MYCADGHLSEGDFKRIESLSGITINVTELRRGTLNYIDEHYKNLSELNISICQYCKEYSVWLGEKMIFPQAFTAPLPDEDMPDDVKKIYEEARGVADISPRAAAALLRVALEKLTARLGEKEGTLNDRIKKLNQKGLPEKVIQSLDTVRILANEGGAHAGVIDLTGEDNKAIVNGLFFLVNFIVEKTISDPKKVDEMVAQLPEEKKAGIENRDKSNEPSN